MKYSSTPRFVNIVIFSILFAAFGALGIYFGFVVAPSYFATDPGEAAKFLKDYPYNFALNFAVIGFSLMLVAGVGIFFSAKALKRNSTDQDVEHTFLVYSLLGYVFAVILALNAIVFNRLIGQDQYKFWAIVFAVLFVVDLIVCNIPVTKFLEDADPNIIQGILALTIAIIGLSFFVPAGLTYINAAKNPVNIDGYRQKLGIYSLLSLLSFLLAGAAVALFVLKHKKGGKTKIAPALASLSLAPIGAGFIVNGVLEYLTRNYTGGKPVFSLQAIGVTTVVEFEFVVTNFIVGILLAAASIALLVVSFLPERKKMPSIK